MSIEVGKKVPGKITGITHFGAFVELPKDQTGLIHISEISDSFVKDINDVLSINEEVEVRVLSIDNQGRISLSLREEGAQSERSERRPSARGSSQSRSERPQRQSRPQENRQRSQRGRRPNRSHQSSGDFDKLMSNFLKDSEDRLASIRRNTEGKRGGRGGRRN